MRGWQFSFFPALPPQCLAVALYVLTRNKRVCSGNDASAEPTLPAVSVWGLASFFPLITEHQLCVCVCVFSMGVFMSPHPTLSRWSLHSVLFVLVSGWDMWHCSAFPVKGDQYFSSCFSSTHYVFWLPAIRMLDWMLQFCFIWHVLV